MKERIKSYSFWTALSGAVVLLLNSLGECFGFAIDNDLVSSLIMSIAGILVVFGVVTMPTNKKEDTAQNSENDNNENILQDENVSQENENNEN